METMAQAGMSGFFATHLHGIFKLPLQPDASDRIITKRMIYTSDPTAVDTYTGIEWTYKMDDGICTDSHALVTAAKFGLPVEVLNRAEALALHLDANIEEVGTYDETKASLEINGRLGLMDAARVAKEIIGDECNAVQIPPRWMPPPSLEGSSCLYVLEIGTNPPSLYVGETDALANRMAQHRKK